MKFLDRLNRRFLTATMICFASLLAASATHAVEIIRVDQPYTVVGETAETTRASLDRQRPDDPLTGQRVDAAVPWQLDWRIDARPSFNQCDLARVWTTLRITVIAPRHGAASALSAPERADWERYRQRLDQYIQGQIQIATQAGHDIETALDRLRRPSCAELEAEANGVARGIVQRARAAAHSYTTQTDYGRSQGARFPWTEGSDDQLTDRERAKLQDRRLMIR